MMVGVLCVGGDERIRTADPLVANEVLSQLSYIPTGIVTKRARTEALMSSFVFRSCPHGPRFLRLGTLADTRRRTGG